MQTDPSKYATVSWLHSYLFIHFLIYFRALEEYCEFGSNARSKKWGRYSEIKSPSLS